MTTGHNFWLVKGMVVFFFPNSKYVMKNIHIHYTLQGNYHIRQDTAIMQLHPQKEYCDLLLLSSSFIAGEDQTDLIDVYIYCRWDESFMWIEVVKMPEDFAEGVIDRNVIETGERLFTCFYMCYFLILPD